MSIALRVGSRLPLYCTSMGRVLLAGQGRAAREAYLRRTDLIARTDRTLTEPAALHVAFARVAEEGYALVDQELELGLRSIAVPVMKDGVTVAAINIGVQADRVTMPELRSRYLPVLRRAALGLGTLGLL